MSAGVRGRPQASASDAATRAAAVAGFSRPVRRSATERSGLGGELVNPDTIAYFSILAGLNPVYGLATQIDSLTRGENSSITTAYLLAALSAAHEQWLRTAFALTGKVGA